MAETKAKKSKTTQKATAAGAAAKKEAAPKVASYEKLFALRTARDDARAEALRAEFSLNRLLNIRNLAGTNYEMDLEIDQARKELNAAREAAARASEMFEVEKFTARRSGHR